MSSTVNELPPQILLADNPGSLAAMECALAMTAGVRMIVRSGTSGVLLKDASMFYRRYTTEPGADGLDLEWPEDRARRALRGGGAVVSIIEHSPGAYQAFSERRQEFDDIRIAAIKSLYLSS